MVIAGSLSPLTTPTFIAQMPFLCKWLYSIKIGPKIRWQLATPIVLWPLLSP